MKISTLYKRYIKMIPGIKSYALATALVFGLGMVITLLSWYVDRQRIETQQTSQLNAQADAFKSDIDSRFQVYGQIIRGASGLFRASDKVTSEDWRRYIEEYDLNTNYPGINGVGYVQYVPAASLQSYNDALSNGGQLTSKVYPEGVRDDYAPLTYYFPLSDTANKIIGFDIYTDPERIEVANYARDSGEVSLSKKLTLLIDRGTDRQSSFNTYLPIYQKDTKPITTEERRANLTGYIFADYRAEDFFKEEIDPSVFTAYSAVQVFDSKDMNPAALLYQSGNFKDSDPSKLSPAFTTKVFNRTWTFRFGEPIKNSSNDTQRSNFILIGGTTISFAMAGFLFLVMLTRARAIIYAKQHETQQAKDDLLSLASHQLRTPATAVKQYLGMILEGYTGKINKKQLPALQKAYASNERQLDTINQILYVAKADAGRLSITRNLFDINMLVDEIALDVSDTLEDNGQSLVVERSRKKLKINADEFSIRMVIENLISNAGKYSYSGSQITLKTGLIDGEVYVAVRDEGVGIAVQDYDKLFKKFSRIDNDLSLQVGGSGIGLYIDKVLIELHGGRIEVTSGLGKGSTFTIFFPKNSASNLTDDNKVDTAL